MYSLEANEDNLRTHAVLSKRVKFIEYIDKDGERSLYYLGKIGKYKREDKSWIEVVEYTKLLDGELFMRRLDNFDDRFKILLDYTPINKDYRVQ